MNWRSRIPQGPPPAPPEAAYSDGYDDEEDDGSGLRVFAFKLPDVPAVLTITVNEKMSHADSVGAAYLVADEAAVRLLEFIDGNRQ